MKLAIWSPNEGPQTAFLSSTAREVLYGGAVGGGKTDALAMDALRYSPHPGHRAILMRRERKHLQEIIDRCREIYEIVCPGVQWVETRNRFEFPNKALIYVGYAEHESDIENFKTFQFNYVGFDELTTFTRKQYVYMLSRNRNKYADLPLEMRAGTNPDGPGHAWVFKRFVVGRKPYSIYRYRDVIREPGGDEKETWITRQFIPSTVWDNPHLANRDEYISGLQAMGQQLAEALLLGKWDFFRGQMFPYGKHGGLVQADPELKADRHYVIRALDYGWTDPTVIHWWIVYPPGTLHEERPVMELADSLRLTESSVKTICYMARQRENQLRTKGLDSPMISVADPSIKKTEGTSGTSILDLFQREGFWFTMADNDRQSGWANVRLFLEGGLARVWQGGGGHLMRTLPKLVRDPKKADDIKPGQDDHDADTFRYAAMAVHQSPAVLSDPARSSSSQHQDTRFEQIVEESLQERGSPSSLEGLGAGF